MFGAGRGIRTPEGNIPADLQSAAFGRFATPARFWFAKSIFKVQLSIFNKLSMFNH